MNNKYKFTLYKTMSISFAFLRKRSSFALQSIYQKRSSNYQKRPSNSFKLYMKHYIKNLI